MRFPRSLRLPGAPTQPTFRTVTIRSQSGLRLVWVMAILWNLIAAPATYLGAVPEIEKGNTVAWAALIFPFVGASLLIWALHLTMRWRRFGTSLLDVSGERVALGGWLRGTIATHNLPEDASPHLTLTCINRVVTGNGRDRSVWEKVLWQEEQTVPREGLAAGPEGVAIPVAFRLPTDAPASRSEDSDNRILWRLQAQASIPGVDYKEQFEIPIVVAPAGQVAAADDRDPAAPASASTAPFGEAPERPADARVTVEPGPEGGQRFTLPAKRNVKAGLSVIFFAALFSGFTGLLVALINRGLVPSAFAFVPWLMLLAFSGVSLLLVAIVLQVVFQTTIVDATSGGLVVTGRALGLTHTRRIARDEIGEIKLSIGMQAGTTPYYDLSVARTNGPPARIAAMLRNKREAEWLAAEIKKALR